MAAAFALSRLVRTDVIDPSEVIGRVAKHTDAYVLIGGHAVSVLLDRPRATLDIDLVVPEADAQRIATALAESFPTLRIVDLVAQHLGDNIRLSLPGLEHDKNGDRIDVILDRGVFALALRHRQLFAMGRGRTWLPRLEAAIGLKYAAGISPHRESQDREKDKADFIGLVHAARDKALDTAILDEFGRMALASIGDYEIRIAIDRARRGRPPF